jgi:hypothetical protein
MDYKEINRLVKLARDGGGFAVAYSPDGYAVEIGERTGNMLEGGRPEIEWHKLEGKNAFDFVLETSRNYRREIESIWNELREAGLVKEGPTLLQHVHSLVRSLDDGIARSQLVQDELLDHVTIGSGEIEQTAGELRKIAERLDATSDKMDDMSMIHGSRRPL